MDDIAAVVLAAGKGVRMQSDLPKVLHRILGAPMVRFPLDALDAAGIGRKVVVLGVGREQVEKVLAGRPGVVFALQPEPRGTADAVAAGLSALEGYEGPVVVAYGDTPLLGAASVRAILEAHGRARAACTVATAEAPDPHGYGRIVRDREGRLARIVEEKDATPEERAIREINGGLYAFEAARLRAALGRVEPDNRAGEYYLTDAVRLLLAGGDRIATVRLPFAEMAGVNTRRELVEAAGALALRRAHELVDAGVDVLAPALTWIEVDVSVGEGTTIEPFTVIRRGARIGARCHVGPFAHVAEGTVLEDEAEIGNFVEVKRTTVRRGAKAKHLSYLGDGDIGPKANIGAGTVFCNYDGKTKSKTTVGERAFVGSGTMLVAPVEVGPGATTAAGAVVTKGKKVPPGEVWAGVPARPFSRRDVEPGRGASPGTGPGTGTGGGT